MMHGSDYSGENIVGWIADEKMDGFFARWTGKTLLTRDGKNYNAPDWFTEKLPPMPLDCELFAGYGKRAFLNNCHRWKEKKLWEQVSLFVFDAPTMPDGFAKRTEALKKILVACGFDWRDGDVIQSKAHLSALLQAVLARGGEGLMLRHPDAPYKIGRVRTMLKVKTLFQ